MSIEVSILVSVIAVCLTTAFGFTTWKRNTRTDTQREAGQTATIITKLDGIKADVREIKDELRGVKEKVEIDHDRIVRLEESSKQAHKRIDSVERKKSGDEP